MPRFVRELLAVAICLSLQAQGGLDGRLASAERVMDRYYRGERLESAVDRANQGIRDFNALALTLQAKLEKERIRLEAVMAPIEEAKARLKAMDQKLKDQMDAVSQETVKRRVDERNALVRQINAESAKAREATEAYNALVRRTQQQLEVDRKRAVEAQDSVNARLAEYAAFTKSGQDAAFFLDLNRLLAEIRQGLRQQPGKTTLLELLARVRDLRRELAGWAIQGQALRPNGLVIVEALVGDEPAWFIVDSGAMDTILSEEILAAIGQNGELGKATSLSVVGGLRVSGQACRIPSLSVAGKTLTDVAASAVRPSDVGIDGLLGQSFLKAFVYTIDERTPAKLILIPR